LAQYEIGSSGQTNRDYIYVGDRLVAEYRPLESKYYYYTPDQINSVRMITNNTGTVVYSATYDPYGGIEKTWVSSYSPKLKFSGKERDSESGMDYFAARYYNRTQYRFNSPDPVIAREDPISNPQLWNLYAYCRNSPINHLDLSGRYGIDVHYYMTYYLAKQAGFSPSEAAVIARANQSVDRSPATSPMRFWRKGFSESLGSWHFAQEEKVNQLIVEAYKSGDLHELGRALHVLQDSLYAHLGYKVPFGHVWDTLTGKNPDLTYRDVEKALRMAQHTLDILIGFRGTEGKRINEEFLRSYFQTRNKEDKIKMINQQ
jgi:RHS repeat-associated protein